MSEALDQVTGDNWTMIHGDSTDVLKGLPENSIGYSVYSVPFSSLFTYSASDRDLGNCKNDDEFFEHYKFILAELYRVLKPGRCMSVHCMDLPTSMQAHGVIGIRDFPGDIIRAAAAVGFTWHSKVMGPPSRITIWKDPVVAVTRTHALGLLHKQLLKDSCRSRMGIPDYVLTFRKPGDNPEPVSHTKEEFPVAMWQKWASPVWDDIDESDTLNARAAREPEDSRHVCPLQLEVIRRCLFMWSNPGDVVLSPFAGIGSEGYVALQERRKFVGIELKRSYFEQAVRNLRNVTSQKSLFEVA